MATAFEAYTLAAKADWDGITHHRFVQELVDDSLSDAVLRDYVVQDWVFCQLFIALMGQAVASGDLMSAKVRFSKQLGCFANSEDGWFQRRFEQFGISKQEQNEPELKPATKKFSHLMQQVLESRNYKRIVVLLTVAEASYLAWAEKGTRSGTVLPQKEQNLGWIELHRGLEFEQWTSFLIEELNRTADPNDKELSDLFGEAVKLEREFFDNAYSHRS